MNPAIPTAVDSWIIYFVFLLHFGRPRGNILGQKVKFKYCYSSSYSDRFQFFCIWRVRIPWNFVNCTRTMLPLFHDTCSCSEPAFDTGQRSFIIIFQAMNINGGDKRNVFWKRGPDSIPDNHNSNTTWNMLQYIIAGAPNTRSCWISISWCLELADLAFTGSPIYCLAHYFCFYVRTIQACPSGRRFQFTHWWKVQTKMKFLIKTLFTFW